MRVKIGEVVDVKKDFTMRNLSIPQKISVILGALVADSKILGRNKKLREEAVIRKRGEQIDSLKDHILASIQYHLKDNNTLKHENKVAIAVILAIDREYSKILPIVLESKEFGMVNVEYVALDNDLTVCFENSVPILLRISRKEV